MEFEKGRVQRMGMNLASPVPSPVRPSARHRSRAHRVARQMLLILALSCPLWHSASTLAAPTPKANGVPSSQLNDEEEQFDEKLRQFGYWSGAAHNCAAGPKQPEMLRKVMEVYQRIASLFGTDRAFFYAAAFGRGTGVDVDKASCPDILERFRKATLTQSGITQEAR